ncbi:MAG: decarboxylating 6-phosphogluconate dehydrogenase [Deltaproteobacteria bacterium]|nr:decarboxylating 6-phosphogluconate dehydrogenase [Deltaproteobacteria bacterium]MCL4874479.1 decarboxylating 6-phosphogluconate dehydrogenase [bacterium]
MDVGMIGLGRMGLNMARRLQRGGHRVVGYNRTDKVTKGAEAEGIEGAYSLAELADKLPAPRTVWMMLPAGDIVDRTIEALKPLLAPGDTVVDGGNTYYKDDLRRSEELKPLGLRYMDAGVSGGIWGLEKGYCTMIGGERGAFEALEPLLKTLAPPGGYLWCGAVGAGHFMKMVHNGIEYGLMEAYAEGFELINASPYADGIRNAELARLWNRGSVVRSWLLELLESAFDKEDGLESIIGYVEDSGEGRWMVKEAVDMGVSIPAITESLMRRFRSRQEEPFGEKLLAALREEFGGHTVKRVPE